MSMTRLLAIQSSLKIESARDAGSIRRVIEERGGHLEWIRRETQALPPSSEGYDGLVVFGGEMSVYDANLSTYFAKLADLVRHFHAADKPVLGSCLGSQVIAYAFGAEVRPGPVEYGYVPVSLTQDGAADPLLADAPKQVHLFEMHGDTFDLPAQATLLMRGDIVAHQVFRVGRSTYAFQCHFEVTRPIIERWSGAHLALDDRISATVARRIEEVEREIDMHQPNQLAFADLVMNRWVSLVEARARSEASVSESA